MLYHSTRSTDHAVDARTAIVQGLSDDGGLFVSDALGEKKIDLATLANESYSSLAVRVLSILLDDFSTDELTGAVERAYRGKFATEEITPVTPLGRDWLLELYHGPTSAFKDLALCLLPQLMSLGLKDKKDKVMIATATSGGRFPRRERYWHCCFLPRREGKRYSALADGDAGGRKRGSGLCYREFR